MSANTPQQAQQHEHEWTPDPRWFHPVLAVLLAYVLAWVPRWGGLTPWVMTGLGVAVAAAGLVWARQAYPPRCYGPTQHGRARDLGLVVGAACGTWWVYAGLVGPTYPTALATALLGALLGGGAYAVLHSVAERHAEETLAALSAAPPGTGVDEDRALALTWLEIYRLAGFPGCQVVDLKHTAAGYTVAMIPDAAKAATFHELTTALHRITVNASIVLARQGVTVRSGDVTLEETGSAHVWLTHISTEHPHDERVDYTPSPTPRSINDPLDVGRYVTGDLVALSLARNHMMMVATTGGGKSVFANCCFARITECVDALVWVGATSKLMPLVYPWLRPWLDGRMRRPILDWVAGEKPDEVLTMLAAAYQEMCRRNKRNTVTSKLKLCAADPAIVVFLEEAANIARRTDRIYAFDGQLMTAERLIFEITTAGRSAGVTVKTFGQSALVEALGPQRGSEVARNLTVRVAGKTMNPNDGYVVLPMLSHTVDTTMLRDNTLLIQPSEEAPRPLAAKAYYLEDIEDEPSRIHPVAIHNGQFQPRLSPDAVAALGVAYTQRWAPARCADLVAAASWEHLDWPVPAEADANMPAPPPPPVELPAGGGVKTDPLEEAWLAIIAELGPLRPAPEEDPPMDTPPSFDVSSHLSDFAAATASMGSRRVPEPLYSVLELLAGSDAPDFVPTWLLAVNLGRVDREAPKEQREAAAAALGMELAKLVPGLKTRQRRVGDKVHKGYDVARLKEAAHAVTGGAPLSEQPED